MWAAGQDNEESYRHSVGRLGGELGGAPEKPPPFVVWPDNWLAVELLALLQWRYVVGDRVQVVGIDQGALWRLIDRHPRAPSGKAEAFTLFEDLMLAADVVSEIWNKG